MLASTLSGSSFGTTFPAVL